MTIYHELEPAYLLGDFALKAADSGFVIVPPRPLDVGSRDGHVTVPDGTMWLTAGIGIGGAAKAQGDGDPSVVFDLGERRDLAAVKVWNYNEVNLTAARREGDAPQRVAHRRGRLVRRLGHVPARRGPERRDRTQRQAALPADDSGQRPGRAVREVRHPVEPPRRHVPDDRRQRGQRPGRPGRGAVLRPGRRRG